MSKQLYFKQVGNFREFPVWQTNIQWLIAEAENQSIENNSLTSHQPEMDRYCKTWQNSHKTNPLNKKTIKVIFPWRPIIATDPHFHWLVWIIFLLLKLSKMFKKTFELPWWSVIQIRLCMASNQRFNDL